MCANYAPTHRERLLRWFGVAPERDDFVDDAYPGHLTPVIHAGEAGRRADLAVFGLIPPWSRDGKNFRSCYNARSETVAEKPSFRNAWHRRQWCVIAADAFYEPLYEAGRPVRWRIEGADGRPLAIAGIWERWRAPGGDPVLSCSMLTINADAHPVMGRFHAPGDERRSVVLLEYDRVDDWLCASEGEARAMLVPFAPDRVRTVASPRPPRRRDPRPPDPPAPGPENPRAPRRG